MNTVDLINTAITVALNGKLTSGEEYFYRKVCRFYSKTFSTKLQEVYEIDPYEVFLTYYEESVERFDLDAPEDVQEILDKLYTIENPEYTKAKEDDLIDFMKQVEKSNEKQLDRLNQKNDVDSSIEKSFLEKEEESLKNLPKGGMINLEYLAKLDNETPGFQD